MRHETIVAGSFRDPSGQVHEWKSRIFRTVKRPGVAAFDEVRATGFLDRLVSEGRLVPYAQVEDANVLRQFPDAVYVLEHPRLEVISHPYEWSFRQLKAAALHHLAIMIDALGAELVTSDATAYNIQFIGPNPIFIDHLSFRPYRQGEFWAAHRQFCEQFLNPLLLRAELGIPHNAWFRGALEGIPTEYIARMLPVRARLSFRANVHVFWPSHFQKGTQKDALSQAEGTRSRGLSKAGFEGLLKQLQRWIASLQPANTSPSVWSDYSEANSYADNETKAKVQVVSDFVASKRPSLLLDLGCNSGFYSQVALDCGAQSVVGFDFDQTSLDKAYQRSLDRKLRFLPLFLDAANPSPSQGWAEAERDGFSRRAQGDAVIALAFIHHLAIGKNVPLEQAVSWILERANSGLVEFVPKTDPTVQAMLRHRTDIFPDYTQEAFTKCISQHASIVAATQVSASGRTIFEFERSV
jgi:ribosomal protein L11 methylase PrmA